MKIQRNDVKKWFAKKVYQIICPYIKVNINKSPICLKLRFTLSIFNEKVAEIEISRNEIIERAGI